MKTRRMLLNVTLLAAALALPPLAAADDSRTTAGAAGIYPDGTTFAGIDVSALQLGVGTEVSPEGAGLGHLSAVLLGVSALGVEQRISIEGAVTGGARNAANVVVLTGLSTVDLGDGLAPAVDVPFTATLTSDGGELGLVGLALVGFSELPNATLNQGSLTIASVPAEPVDDGVTVAGE